jgi:hypothetical protein
MELNPSRGSDPYRIYRWYQITFIRLHIELLRMKHIVKTKSNVIIIIKYNFYYGNNFILDIYIYIY